jgi:hypothetical protein
MRKKGMPDQSAIQAKGEFISAYFDERKRQLARARKLINQQEYLLEGILVLCCHIDSFATLRFPFLKSRAAFKQVLLKYSGKRAFYEKIDLLFLYQWPTSHLRNNGDYKTFKNY